MSNEETHWEKLERELKTAPMTWVPALLGILVQRCAVEPIFKGWMGMHSYIQKAYKGAGGSTEKNGAKNAKQ